jgi:hypothetical protein
LDDVVLHAPLDAMPIIASRSYNELHGYDLQLWRLHTASSLRNSRKSTSIFPTDVDAIACM